MASSESEDFDIKRKECDELDVRLCNSLEFFEITVKNDMDDVYLVLLIQPQTGYVKFYPPGRLSFLAKPIIRKGESIEFFVGPRDDNFHWQTGEVVKIVRLEK